MAERDWNDPALHCLALHLAGSTDSRRDGAGDLLAVFNAAAGPVDFRVPAVAAGGEWKMLLDTAQPDGEGEPRVVHCNEALRLEPRSTVLLESQPPAGVA
jgi:pullulanase/glycogen debranching enzyme